MILRGEEFREDQESDVEQLCFIFNEHEAFTNMAKGAGYVIIINTIGIRLYVQNYRLLLELLHG